MCGTEPNFHSYRACSHGESVLSLITEMIDSQREEGASFFRATLVDKQHNPCSVEEQVCGVWVDGWLDRPMEQAPFNPPLVLTEG